MDQRQKIRESNKQTEKKWTGEIPSSTFAGRFKNIIGDIGGGFVGEHQQATSIRHSVQTVKKDNKEMAIWAIVSELNTVETMKQLSYVCDALTKLGHKGLADRIWAEAMKEDFYLKDKSVDVV